MPKIIVTANEMKVAIDTQFRVVLATRNMLGGRMRREWVAAFCRLDDVDHRRRPDSELAAGKN